jgi:hypothetical protein
MTIKNKYFFNPNIKKINLLFLFLFVIKISLVAQNKQNSYVITHDDSLALEKVVLEKYYIADSSDYNDTSANPLPYASITYRIFIDMKPDYMLQLVYGSPIHELVLETTTKFFNDLTADAITGFNVNLKKLNIGNVALDSWITMGAAARGYTGIIRTEDTSGISIIDNRPALKIADGFTKSILPDFKIFNIDINFFNNDSTAKRFYTNNGGWAAPYGVKGPTPENRVLIAQLTTNGKLSFKLNIQIGTPAGGYVKFVADKPENGEIKFGGLNLK